MSVHSYTLRSLLVLTVLLQVACNKSKPKNIPPALKLAAEELDRAAGEVLETLGQAVDDTAVSEAELEVLKQQVNNSKKATKKPKKGKSTSAEGESRNAIIAKESIALFETISSKFLQAIDLIAEDKKNANSLPEVAKLRSEIRNNTLDKKLRKAFKKFAVEIEKELIAKGELAPQ